MVRRGSTVRVRQRALQKPRIMGLFVSDRDLQVLERGAGMEPFREPLGRKRAPGEGTGPTIRGSTFPSSTLTAAFVTSGGYGRSGRLLPRPHMAAHARLGATRLG